MLLCFRPSDKQIYFARHRTSMFNFRSSEFRFEARRTFRARSGVGVSLVRTSGRRVWFYYNVVRFSVRPKLEPFLSHIRTSRHKCRCSARMHRFWIQVDQMRHQTFNIRPSWEADCTKPFTTDTPMPGPRNSPASDLIYFPTSV